jgi:SAM-dependent methyltransferase
MGHGGDATLKYEDWERGCAADSVRNEFVVPQIVEFFSRTRPDTILDVGSLTGYMAREINTALSYAPAWTLLDCDAGAVAFARASIPAGMSARLINQRLQDFASGEKFAAALLTFTLLELGDRTGIFEAIGSQLREGGHLVIALPDCLQDVIAEVRSGAQLDLLDEFVRADVQIPKIDKFTAEPYPFFAVRLTRVIAEVIEANFTLIELMRHDFEEGGVFLMYFQRLPVHG